MRDRFMRSYVLTWRYWNIAQTSVGFSFKKIDRYIYRYQRCARDYLCREVYVMSLSLAPFSVSFTAMHLQHTYLAAWVVADAKFRVPSRLLPSERHHSK